MFQSIVGAPFKHWKKLAGLWVLMFGAVVLATALMQPRYRSDSKLFVRLGRENATLDPAATIGQGPVVTIPASREYELNSVVDLLKSRAIAEQVVDILGAEAVLEKPPGKNKPAGAPVPAAEPSAIGALVQKLSPFEPSTAREAAIRKLSGRLTAGTAKKSNIINVSYEAASPETAQEILAALVEVYLTEHVRVNRTPGSHDFLIEQVEAMQKKLATSEKALLELKNTASVASLDEQRRLLEIRLASLVDQSLEVDASLAMADAQAERLEQTLENLPGNLVANKVEGHPNAASDLMQQQLYALQLKEQEMLAKYTEEHFLIKQIRQQVAEAKALANVVERDRTQTTTALNNNREQLHLQLLSAQTTQASLSAKQDKLASQLEETRTSIVALNRHGTQLTSLERAVALDDTTYRKYAESVEQTRLDQALASPHFSNVAVAQSPSLQPRAVRPRKLWNYAGGFVFATATSLALVILLELMQGRVTTPRDVEEELAVSTLVTLPRMVGAATRAGSRLPR